MCGRGCQFPRCWVSVSDGLPVGLVAVVSTLDTLPAVRVWDWLPVVSTLDTLPACEPVGWSACRIGCLWSIPSTYCQPVSLCRGLCRSVGWSATVPAVRVWDVLPV